MKVKIDYFGINFFFFIGMLFFLFIPSIVVDIDGSFYAFIIGVIGISCFLFGARYNKRINIGRVKFPTACNYIGLVICVYYFLSTVNFLLSSVVVDSYTEKYLNVNYIQIYMGLLNVPFGFLTYYILAAFVGIDKKKYFIVFLLSVLVKLHSETRLDLILPIVFWCGYGYYLGLIKITIARVFSVLALTPLIFTFLLLKRVMKGSYENFFEQMQSIYDYLNFTTLIENIYVSMEIFRSYELYVRIVSDNFIHIESGFLRIVFMFIPRSLWPDKPESVSRIISHNYYPEQYYGGGGTVANIFGDAYINGGIIGVVIILFIWGGISKIIYNTTIKDLKDGKNNIDEASFLVTFYLLYLLESIQYFRGFMSESFWKLLYLILITMIISRVLRKNDV